MRETVLANSAVVCAVLSMTALASQAHAAGCTPGPGTTIVAMPTCDYGIPARSTDLLLVPKVCRTPVDGKLLERHAVEVRSATGARIGQASLPAVPVQALAPVPLPGVLLGGPYPLLVSANGIAALEARAGRAELVFEPTGKLLGVARLGEVLAIVEVAAPDEHFPKGSIEWTVLDYGAGEVIGQLQLAGQDLEGLSLRPSAAGGVEAVLERQLPAGPKEPAKKVEVVAPVRDRLGKTAAPGGTLVAKVRPLTRVAEPAAKPGPGQCFVLAPTTSILIGQPRLVVSPVLARSVQATGGESLTVPGPDACLALQELDDKGNAWAWFQTAAGARELRPQRCVR